MSLVPPAIHLVHHPRVTSTMDVLDDLITAGAPEWTVVLADEQTSGLGRSGRTWEARPNSALLCSISVRPRLARERSGMLAIAVGLALAEYLESLGARVVLKWPNDVLVDERKLAGILIRTRHDRLGLHANVGIGLNLKASQLYGDERVALDEMVSPLPERAEILSQVVARLAPMVMTSDTSGLPERWMSRAAYVGERVTVAVGQRSIRGALVGIDDRGALLLEDESGVCQAVVAGDVVRGPRVARG